MTRSTRPKTNRTPSDHDQPDNDPTTSTDDASPVTIDPDDDTQVVAGVTHYHAGEQSLHRQGLDPHWHQDNGEIRWGEWVPAGIVLWEWTGLGHPDDHRHDGRHDHHHDRGQFEHMHDPNSNDLIMLAEQGQISTPEPGPAEGAEGRDDGQVEASQAGHPSGREPTDEVLPGYAAEIERQLAETRDARDRLDAIPTPQPPTPPTPTGRSGGHTPGASIADPIAENTRNALMFHVVDPTLQHEMNWHPILLRAVVQMTTYHADERLRGGPGPELIPDDLLEAAQGALDQIVFPRRAAAAAREARP